MTVCQKSFYTKDIPQLLPVCINVKKKNVQAELTIFFREINLTKIFVKLISLKFQPFLCCHSACTFFKCLLVTIVISEFLAWLLFLKTRLCKEKKATHTFICWVFVATKKNIKTTKKNLKKTKTNKTQKNSSRIF